MATCLNNYYHLLSNCPVPLLLVLEAMNLLLLVYGNLLFIYGKVTKRYLGKC